jgi:CBS domain-containing protein
VFEHTLRGGHRALPVVETGQLVGMMSVTDAKHLAHEAWRTTPIREVMTRLPLKTLGTESDLNEALELMVANEVNQLPVVHDGRLLGMLRRSDVMRCMQLGDELHLNQSDLSTERSEPRPATAHG